MAHMIGHMEHPIAGSGAGSALPTEKRLARVARLVAEGMRTEDAALNCGFGSVASYYTMKSKYKKQAAAAKTMDALLDGKLSLEEVAWQAARAEHAADEPDDITKEELPPVDEAFPLPDMPPGVAVNEAAAAKAAMADKPWPVLRIGRVDGTLCRYERTDAGVRVTGTGLAIEQPHDPTAWRALMREMEAALELLDESKHKGEKNK